MNTLPDGSVSPLLAQKSSGYSQRYGTSSRTRNPSSTFVSPVWAVVVLLVVQALERLAFLVINNNIGIYAMAYLDLRVSGRAFPTPVTTLVVGTAYVLAPLYGLLSDAKFGKFKLLIGCFSAYCVGVFLIVASAYTLSPPGDPNTLPLCLYFSGLAVVILFSAPGITATLVPFMLEQMTDGEHQRNRHLTAFVSWSCFAIKVGEGTALLLGGYLQSRAVTFTDLKSEDHSKFPGFFWRYLLALCSLCLSLVILIIWKSKFKRNRPSSFYKPSIKAIFSAAFCKRVQRHHFNIETLRWYEQEAANEIERRNRERKDDIRRLADTLPLMCALILYFTIQSQAETSFVNQGLQLNSEKLDDLPIPPVDLTFGFDALAVIVSVPVMLFCVKPLYERIAGRTLYNVVVPRIRWGMILAFVSCGLATLVASCRAGRSDPPNLRAYSLNKYNIHDCFSDIPIYTQVPQYVLLGTSTVLAAVGFMEFVLSSSPRQFRSTMFGMVYFISGLSRFVGVLLLAIIEGIEPSWYYPSPIIEGATILCDIDKETKAKPYVYFMILTCLITGNLVFFLIFESRFRKFVRITPLPRKRTAIE